MLELAVVGANARDAARWEASRALLREFPRATVASVPRVPKDAVRIIAEHWSSPTFRPTALDERVLGPGKASMRLALITDDLTPSILATAHEVLTRYQLLQDRRNTGSSTPRFDAVLAAHRALHALEKPLVRADYWHALDTWQWTLRLDPDASFELQLAALFHDIERLESEVERRVEQHEADYVSFKARHARRGAAMACGVLANLGVAGEVLAAVRTLIEQHEVTDFEHARALLNDADALSFFSLNSSGFLDYFGEAHTQKKVVYTLGRMSRRALALLERVRLRSEVARLVAHARVA